MQVREFLTTEQMAKRFKSPFDLVNYAIELAKNAIATGRAMQITTDVQNLAQLILLEILNYQDTFDSAFDDEDEDDEEFIEATEEIVEQVKVKPAKQKVAAKGAA